MTSAYRLEHTLEALVRNPILQGDVDRVPLALSTPSIFLGSCSGEIFSELVETACHDAVGGVKCFFDSISVVTVDVDVEYAGICS